MDGVDRGVAAVLQAVRAADLYFTPVGMNLDAQVGTRQPGLWDACVPSEPSLVLGLPVREVGGG